MGAAQLLARSLSAALAAQPFSVEEVGSGELRVDAGGVEPLDRLAVEDLGALTLADQRPRAGLDQRLVYLSSGMHRGGEPDLDDLQWTRRRWNCAQAYADSKLFDVVLAFAVALRWPGVLSNALEPGWVPTKMGGPGAPDDLSLAPVTPAWLAVSGDPAAAVTGGYFFHQRPREVDPAARAVDLQEGLLEECAHLTGIPLPPP